MTTQALERAARAVCDNESALMGWHPDRAWVAQKSKYIDFARAVLMAVLPTLKRHDCDQAGSYLDDRGDFVLYADLEAILGEGEGE